MGGEGKLKDTANVADTCMAAMALYRSGNTPSSGEYRQERSGGRFPLRRSKSPMRNRCSSPTLRGTRTQSKLGQYIDTFLSAQVLAEVKNQMPDESSSKRVNGRWPR